MWFRTKKSNTKPRKSNTEPREDVVFMVLRGKEFVATKPIAAQTPELRAFKGSIPVIIKPLVPGREKEESTDK